MKISKQLIALSAITLTTIFTACNKNDNEEQQTPRADIQLTQSQKQLAENGNEFAVNAFKAANQQSENALITPYSYQLSLAMLANGAQGETLSEIVDALHIGTASVNDLNEFYKTVTAGLTAADSKVSLKIANAIWTAKTITPRTSYIEALEHNYSAKATSIDFSSPDALATINKWTSNATAGKINNLFKQIDPTSSMCIVNAMAFEGKWAKRFEEKSTHNATFKNWKNEQEQCQMMSGTFDVGIATQDDADMLEMDYGNGSFVMDIILPKDGCKINDFVASLTTERINSYITAVKPTSSVVVKLPKFEAKYNYNLIEQLKSLGINKIFGDADFSGIADKKMAVTQYVQQSWIKVDEEGTKVTTATGAVTGDIAYIGGAFTVDSPFVYMIRERSTGVILAIGKVQTMAGMQ